MANSNCPHCGYSNPVASQFCVQCGTIIAGQKPPPAPSGESADEPDARAADQEAAPPQRGEEGASQQAPTESSDADDPQSQPHAAAEEDVTDESAQIEGPRRGASQAGPLLRDLAACSNPQTHSRTLRPAPASSIRHATYHLPLQQNCLRTKRNAGTYAVSFRTSCRRRSAPPRT